MKGIKTTVTVETTYSFDITEDNGFDLIDFNNLEDILEVVNSVKKNPQHHCSAFGLEDSEIRYDEGTKVTNVVVNFIKEAE